MPKLDLAMTFVNCDFSAVAAPQKVKGIPPTIQEEMPLCNGRVYRGNCGWLIK